MEEKIKDKIEEGKANKTNLLLGIAIVLLGLMVYAAPDSVQFLANTKELAHLIGILFLAYGLRFLNRTTGE